MARRVSFCFHYQDVIDFRANVVRNHWMTKPHREAAGFFDVSLWEDAEKHGDVAIKRLINSGLEGTSTSCVLIGSQTYNRPWVTYEIMKSFKRGNSILAIHINSITGKDKRTKPLGPNPSHRDSEWNASRALTKSLYSASARHSMKFGKRNLKPSPVLKYSTPQNSTLAGRRCRTRLKIM
jgi:hypothetical protein